MDDSKYLIEALTSDLISLLIDRNGMNMESAFHTLYTSATFSKLQKKESGLYIQSPLYVYDFLREELGVG